APNVPWKREVTFTVGANQLSVASMQDDFHPELPLYLDYPSKRQPQVLRRSQLNTDAAPTFFVARPTDTTLHALPKLRDDQWGVVVAASLVNEDQARTQRALRERGWGFIPKGTTLATIFLNK